MQASEKNSREGNGYMQRERLRRFIDQSKKVTWETIEKLNEKELKGLTNQNVDLKAFLEKPTEEEARYFSSLKARLG